VTANPLSSLRRLGRSWLVWLAIMLPLAQTAAVWHGVSHGVQQQTAEDKQAPHPAHCELCLAAADLGAGALPSVAPGFATPPAGHELKSSPASSVWAAPATLAYLSRAPPSTPV
jgi:hypothetical protein